MKLADAYKLLTEEQLKTTMWCESCRQLYVKKESDPYARYKCPYCGSIAVIPMVEWLEHAEYTEYHELFWQKLKRKVGQD